MIGISGTVSLSGGRGRLRPEAAASIARVDHELGRLLDINSAWRSPVTQARLRKAYIDYLNGRGPWAPIALEPEDSVHCDGWAIDTDDGQPVGSRTDRILVDHGWILTVYRNGNLVEPWHREYDKTRDNHLEDDMAITDSDAKKIADAVFNREARDGRTVGEMLVGIPSAAENADKTWSTVVGTKDSPTVSYGRAGHLLARADTRAGKAAGRAQSILDQPSGGYTPAQVTAIADQIADELRADLPAAVVAELGKRLSA
jgi:hypothetical protein